MKKPFIYIILSLVIFSCETEVDPSLDGSLNILVIDAFLTNNDPTQHINITRSQPYFDERFPEKVKGAIVTVTDLTDNSIAAYTFQEEQDRYTWQSADGSGLGILGHQYELRVELNGNVYTSVTSLEDAPPIDSITFRLEEGNAFFDDLIFAELFATDLVGLNDTYWIKTWKNGEFLGDPGQINIAYDAAFSPAADNDGVQFIQPIRDAISPFEEAKDGTLLSPYNLPDTLIVRDTTIYNSDGSYLIIIDENKIDSSVVVEPTVYGTIRGNRIFFEEANIPDYIESLPLNDERYEFLNEEKLLVRGDSVYVEIHSISNEAFFFMNQVIIETTREGGFGALFATPLANVSTNIVPENPDTPVLGFFNIATVSSAGVRLTDESQVRVVE